MKLIRLLILATTHFTQEYPFESFLDMGEIFLKLFLLTYLNILIIVVLALTPSR